MNGLGGASGPHAAAAWAGEEGKRVAAQAVSTANTAAAKRTQGIFAVVAERREQRHVNDSAPRSPWRSWTYETTQPQP